MTIKPHFYGRWILIIIPVFFLSCKLSTVNDSNLKFSANKNFTNFLLMAEGDHSGGIGPSVAQDPKHIQNIVAKAGLNFTEQVHLPNEPSSTELGAAITDLAKRSLAADLAYLEENPDDGFTPLSTVFVYLTSHGGPGGYTSVGGGEAVQSGQIIQWLAAGRKLPDGTSLPIQRVVIMWDTCHAASNIAGISNAGNTVASSGGSSILSGLTLASSGSNQISGTTASSMYSNISKSYKATTPVDQNFLNDKIQTTMTSIQSIDRGKIFKSLILIMSSRAAELSNSETNGGTATLAFGAAVTSSLSGAGLNGSLGPLTSALGGIDETNPSQQQATSSGPKSNKTIEEVLNLMVKNGIAGGQTPVWCVEPPEVAKDYFAQRPDDKLPVTLPALGSGSASAMSCSDNSHLSGEQ